MIMITHYEYRLTPDATIAVEESGNVVLRTPERRITITNVAEWISQLEIARTLARVIT
jgi:hypothetical protein